MALQLVSTGRRTSGVGGATVPPFEPGVPPVEPFPPLEPEPDLPPVEPEPAPPIGPQPGDPPVDPPAEPFPPLPSP